jgi:hypothetical protein
MEVIRPDYSLILWSLLVLTNLLLAIIAIYKLAYQNLSFTVKLSWLFGILFVPFAGAIGFFTFRKMKSQIVQ